MAVVDSRSPWLSMHTTGFIGGNSSSRCNESSSHWEVGGTITLDGGARTGGGLCIQRSFLRSQTRHNRWRLSLSLLTGPLSGALAAAAFGNRLCSLATHVHWGKKKQCTLGLFATQHGMAVYIQYQGIPESSYIIYRKYQNNRKVSTPKSCPTRVSQFNRQCSKVDQALHTPITLSEFIRIGCYKMHWLLERTTNQTSRLLF